MPKKIKRMKTTELSMSDPFTIQHLRAYAQRHHRECERESVISDCTRFATEHPDILSRLGWPEILQLSRRKL